MRSLVANNTRRVQRLNKANPSYGFTIIEMLVVIPMIVLVVGVLIAALVSLLSSIVTANQRSALTYSLQDALDQIEQDVRLAISIETTATAANSQVHQAANNQLILKQYATDRNPSDPDRELIYTSTTINPCRTTTELSNKLYRTNNPLTIQVVYFTDANNTLWRRTIVPSYQFSSTSPSSNTVCGSPWQQSSCNNLGGACKILDTRVANNVTNKEFSYAVDFSSSTTSLPTENTTVVGADIKLSTISAGQRIETSGKIKAKKINN